MQLLITGSAGFIGSHLSERLLADGHTVVGFDNFDPYYSPDIKRRNVQAIQAVAAGRFQLIEGSITEPAVLEKAFREHAFDAVVHLAAQAGVRPSIVDPAHYVRINVGGLVNLMEAMRHAGVKKIVAASSSSVYGNTTPVPFREDAPCAAPQSPYGASKRASEIFLGTAHQLHGFDALVVRPFTVYGPRQRPDMAIAAFARKILYGEPLTLFGDGSSARDYTFVSDIVDGICAALRFPKRYGIYNLGGDQPVTLNELITRLEKVTGKKAVIKRESMQAGDVERTYADLTNSRRDLGYAPKVSLDEGLRRTVEWVKSV